VRLRSRCFLRVFLGIPQMTSVRLRSQRKNIQKIVRGPRRRSKRSLIGAAIFHSLAKDVHHRHNMFIIGTRCSSPAQDVPRRHKMFLAGTRCSSPAQDVPRRRKMLLAGAASGPSSAQQAVPHRRSKRSLIGTSGPSSAQQAVPRRRSNRSKRSLVGAAIASCPIF
jgi:hypothetical protein